MINTLPDNVFVEIFGHCRMDDVGRLTWGHHPWKWHRLAHVCRTWRHIMFASSRHLHLELLCTHGTPVKKNLGHLPAFPIVVSFLNSFYRGGDRDNLFAALEHRDRVRVVEVNVPRSLLKGLATVMQEPFPALAHLRFESGGFEAMPTLPDSFLGGSAPLLRTIYMSGIPFPAAPALLLSAHDLVYVHLRIIPRTGYIPPEVMVSSLAVLPGLKYLTLGFEWGMPYPGRGRIRQPPITRTVLPVLSRFTFYGPIQYLEDLVAQIDTPQLDYLRITYQDWHQIDFQIPQLCGFVDRSEKLKLSRFRRADILLRSSPVVIELFHLGQSPFRLSIPEGVVGQVVSQLSAMLSNVDCLFINSDSMEGDDELIGYGIRWLELFRPFTAVKALSVDDKISRHILFVLSNIAGESAAEVLPALELLCLENELVKFVKEFVAARLNMGRPVTFINEEREFRERLKTLGVSK